MKKIGYHKSIFRHMVIDDRDKMLEDIVMKNIGFLIKEYDFDEKEIKESENPSKDVMKFFRKKSVGTNNFEKEKEIVEKFLLSKEEIYESVVLDIHNTYNQFLEHYFTIRNIKMISLHNPTYKRFSELKSIEEKSVLLREYLSTNLSKENDDRKITEIENSDDKYLSFSSSQNQVSVLHRIGIFTDPVSKENNSVFVKYIVDFENGFLEFHWNSSNIKNLLKFNRENNHQIENVDELIERMILNLNSWFDDDFSDNTILNVNPNDGKDIKGFHAENISQAYMKSPLEAALYNIFIKDHERIVKRIEQLKDFEFSSLEIFMNKFFDSNSLIENKDNVRIDALNSIGQTKNVLYFSAVPLLELDNLSSYIYSFTLRDIINYTSSKTKNDRKKPIYTNEPYWNLMSIIKRVKLITELSMHFELKAKDIETTYIQKFTISIRNNLIVFDFLQKNSNKDRQSRKYISNSRRAIYGEFKKRIRQFIDNESKLVNALSSD